MPRRRGAAAAALGVRLAAELIAKGASRLIAAERAVQGRAEASHDRPLLKPIVVTRAEERDGPLSAELESLGLSVLVWAAVRRVASRRRARWMRR